MKIFGLITLACQDEEKTFALVVLDNEPGKLWCVDAEPGEIGDAFPLGDDLTAFIADRVNFTFMKQGAGVRSAQPNAPRPFLVQSRGN